MKPTQAVVASRHLRLEPLEARCLLSANAASDAVNAFAADAYQHLQQEEGNLFFSPLSISAALAMTSAGAAGQTAAEMQQVFHLGADPSIHGSFRELLVSQLARSITVDDFELTQANSIWPDDDLLVEPSFINTIETQYFGHVEQVDYADPQQAEDTINAWVADQTDGRIEDLVSGLSPLTTMVLTNAVNFDALWDIPFLPDSTYDQEFRRAAGDTVFTPIMYTQPVVARAQMAGFDVLDLPFANGQASMVLAMPEIPGDSNHLTSEAWAEIGAWADSPRDFYKAEVRLPRFETTVEVSLKPLLAGLGMPTAFTGNADFGGIAEGVGYIRKVSHKATIEVNETGTKAAAATEVELFLCFAAGTPVLTRDGSKPIESLRVGDRVFARSENDSEGPIEEKVIEEVRHGVASLLEVTVHGRVIRVTGLHPFFVEGQGWTPAEKLRVGDRLATNGAEAVAVEKLSESRGEESVYNLRVADHHTYFVGEREWGFAVWTHNFYDDGFYADRPFHFMIRDNVTSTIAFMGRVDDPTQLDNSITPTVAYPNADRGDFNNDGVVNQGDHAVWKAAFGRTGATLPGDGNGDGVVNAADYTIWRDHVGLELTPPPLLSSSDSQPADASPISRLPGTGSLVPNDNASRSRYTPASRAPLAINSGPTGDALLLLATDSPQENPGFGSRAAIASPYESPDSPTREESLDQGFAAISDGTDAWPLSL